MRETSLTLQGLGNDGAQAELARAVFCRRESNDAGITQLTGDVTAGPGNGPQAATIANDAVTNAKLANMATATVKGRNTAGAGDPEDLTTIPTGTVPAFTGDVTTPGGSLTTTIAVNAVTDTKLRDSGALSVIGRSTNSSGDPADISATAASAAVLRESGSTIGFGTVATAGIAANAADNTIIRDSGALSVIGRSANSSGDPADIAAAAASDAVLRESGSVLGFGTIATAGIANDAVTYAKMQNVSAASKLLGRGSAAGAGDPEEITLGTNLSMSGTTLNAAASAVSMTQTTIDFGSTAVDHKTFTITDAAVQATSKLIVSVYDTADTDENAEGMDSLTFVTRPAAGSFKLHALVPNGKLVRGIFKIQYLIAA